jgi:hypothetical protein
VQSKEKRERGRVQVAGTQHGARGAARLARACPGFQLRLRKQHAVTADVFMVPLAPPSDQPMILEGLAAAAETDLERVQFRPWAFTWDRTLPPLYLKHDEGHPVGTIQSLSQDRRGLHIRATVTDPHARRFAAWSIGANVLEYEIRNEGTPDFFALVRRAELTEVSLTDIPANPKALVQRRYPVPATNTFFELMAKRVGLVQQLSQTPKELQR